MRILDRYIIRHFLSTFFLMVALFCVVAVVFDVAENLERLIDNDAPWGLVFGEYYLSFCLALGNMLSAFIVFLTILLFTSRLAQRSEIMPRSARQLGWKQQALSRLPLRADRRRKMGRTANRKLKRSKR